MRDHGITSTSRIGGGCRWVLAAAMAVYFLAGGSGLRGQEGKRSSPTGRIEPELKALLPGGGTGYGSEYFAGKSYWYWLKLGPVAPVQYNFTIMGDFLTERYPEFGERVAFSKVIGPGSMSWAGNSFRFSYTDPTFARYGCPPGSSPASMQAAQSWTVQGTLSDDGRKIVSLKFTQSTKTCDVRIVREGYREIRREGETIREHDPQLDVTETYMKTTVLACEIRDLPLRKPDPIILGPQRGVILDYGASEAELKKRLITSDPAVTKGSITVQFNVREEPQMGIVGRVTARNTKPAAALPDDNRPRHPLSFPLPEAKVSLWKEGRPLVSRAAREDGTYFLPFKGPADKLTVKVELEHGASSPSVFKIVHDGQDDPAAVMTEPFSVPASTATPVEVNVEWSDESGVKPLGASADKLYDMGLIYFYTHQSWKLIASKLAGSVPLLSFNPPLVVRAFSTSPIAVQQHAYGDMTKPELALASERSRSAQELRPGTIWHELGHVAMGVMAGHQFPPVWEDPAWKGYHEGYENPNTWASYVEGFAHFFAALVSTHAAGGQAGVIDVNGYARNLSLAENMPWSMRGELEEFAAAALLWDLADRDANSTRQEMNRTILDEIKLDFEPAFPGDTPVKEYKDDVQVELGDLFRLLATPTELDPPRFVSGAAPVWDTRQLHSVLKSAGHGSTPSPRHPGLDALDEVFIAHGFFADATPQNLVYDPGEEIGFSANAGVMEFFWPDPNGLRQVMKRFEPRFDPKRRIPPPPPESKLAFKTRDASGREIDVRDFEVEVMFDGENAAYNYSARVFTAEPGRLPLVCADASMPSTTRIRPLLKGRESTAEFVITGEEYWAAVGKAGRGPFAEHIFSVSDPKTKERASPVGWLPAAPSGESESGTRSGSGGTVLILGLLGAGIVILAVALVVVTGRKKAR